MIPSDTPAGAKETALSLKERKVFRHPLRDSFRSEDREHPGTWSADLEGVPGCMENPRGHPLGEADTPAYPSGVELN